VSWGGLASTGFFFFFAFQKLFFLLPRIILCTICFQVYSILYCILLVPYFFVVWRNFSKADEISGVT
jgi:hypothetical protein